MMIKISGLDALELKRHGHKILRKGREFFVNEKSLLNYAIKNMVLQKKRMA